jgi:ADP-ribose pyrophosphatase YjhB (NUDIX family)
MPMPPFLEDLRRKVGDSLLVLPSASGVVFDELRRILLIRHSNDGKWVVPGGVVEPDEHPARRVVEEVREETGLVVEPVRLVALYGGPSCRVVYPSGDTTSYVAAVYECRIVSGTARPNGDESLEVGYFAEDELPALDLSPIGRTIVRLGYGQLGPLDVAPEDARP